VAPGVGRKDQLPEDETKRQLQLQYLSQKPDPHQEGVNQQPRLKGASQSLQ